MSKMSSTHHFLAEKVKPLKRAHGLCTGLNVLKDHMSLTSHFVRLHSHDVEDDAVGGEQRVERRPEIMLAQFVGKIGAVQSGKLSISNCRVIRNQRLNSRLVGRNRRLGHIVGYRMGCLVIAAVA
jgi:hypothetical protein